MKHSGTILVVDDVSNGRDRFATYLVGQGHQLVFANCGTEALDKATEAAPDVIVLNVSVPDAVQMCQQVRASETLSHTPVAMLAEASDRDARLVGVEAGVDEFISKPLEVVELRARVNTLIRLNDYRRQAKAYEDSNGAREVAAAFDALLESWGQALELRGVEPDGHTQRVTGMALQLARAMGMSDDELVHVRRGAILHDIGKMGIPDRIMFKVGPLDDEEWAEMYKHPLYAHDLLSPIPFLQPALDIPYCHHEKWDGTGYPCGLSGDEIPLAARIFAVVDVWDALHTDRSYRRAWSESQVDDYIHEQGGEHFDPKVVRVFFDLLQRA